MSYTPSSMKRILSWLAIMAAFSCAPTRVVAPLEEGQLQIGASLGQPQINDGALPMLGVYAAKGLSNQVTAYGGAQLSSMYLGALQFDGGIVKSYVEPSGFRPGLSANYGANVFISSRDGAFRLYPDAGANAYWQRGPHIFHLSANTWVDPTWFVADFGQGQPLAPSFGAGYRLRYKWVELQAEYKILNPTRELEVPQATVPSTFGVGGRGFYWGAAINF